MAWCYQAACFRIVKLQRVMTLAEDKPQHAPVGLPLHLSLRLNYLQPWQLPCYNVSDDTEITSPRATPPTWDLEAYTQSCPVASATLLALDLDPKTIQN